MGRIRSSLGVQSVVACDRVVLAVSALLALLLVAPAVAQAGTAWRIIAEPVPSNVRPGGEGLIVLQVENVGDIPSAAGSPVTVVDRLPHGIKALEGAALANSDSVSLQPAGQWGDCAISSEGQVVTCTYQAGDTILPVSKWPGGSFLESFENFGPHTLAPAIGIDVAVEPSAGGTLTDIAAVTGGGAVGQASDTAGLDVSASPSESSGVVSFRQWSTDSDGSTATQGGSDPYEFTTYFTLNTKLQGNLGIESGGRARGVNLELPPGIVGNPNAVSVSKCPRSDFDARLIGQPFNPRCSPSSQVGLATITLETNSYVQLPIYNLVPPANVPAQFGIGFTKVVAYLDANVRPTVGGAYDIVVNSRDIVSGGLVGVSATFWGDPAEASHDVLRDPVGENEPTRSNDVPSGLKPGPFLSLPTSCGVVLPFTVGVSSWEDSLTVPFTGVAVSTDEQDNPVVMEGCSKLDFEPSVEAQAGSATPKSPTGLAVDVKAPQNEDPNGLREADLKDVSVTLPAGMAVSPSAANGLEACSEGQLGVSGRESSLLFNESPVTCPAGSKVGAVEVATPLLEHPLQGELYLAQQDANPFGSLIALYLVAEGSGVLVKRAGEVQLNPQNGQITATFLNNPQVPISEIKVHTFEGPKASLITPAGCGTYAASTHLTGWNGSVTAPSSQPAIAINGNCTQGFKPTFTAWMTDSHAGAFSPFTVGFSRQDSEQLIGDASVETPPGLSAVLPSVQRCPEPQASNAMCGPESQIGHATVAVGPGPEPFYAPANVFLTGPYGGAPFGLSIVARAKAGPFDLGIVVVRARVSVDPHTTQVIVTPDSGGPFAIPTILKGIPLDLRLANITIERPGDGQFLFNPTSCSPLSVTGTMTSTTGTVTPVSSPFQVTGCAKLPFKPVFTASTQAHTSKGHGASLTVKITKKPGEANLHKADIQLPIALPARLTTLQKACTEAQFNADPADCPAGSVIGTARLITPVLSVPVTGPAILVSHGGAAFPDVEFVLQGEGVTVIVDGATDIKKGITYSKFETAPDQPFSSFETRLPEGPYSVLATNILARAKGSLCSQKLTMPTSLTGQNDAVLTQTTKIAVNGCPKTETKPKPARKHKTGGTK
jgi:hypothetical protein